MGDMSETSTPRCHPRVRGVAELGRWWEGNDDDNACVCGGGSARVPVNFVDVNGPCFSNCIGPFSNTFVFLSKKSSKNSAFSLDLTFSGLFVLFFWFFEFSVFVINLFFRFFRWALKWPLDAEKSKPIWTLIYAENVPMYNKTTTYGDKKTTIEVISKSQRVQKKKTSKGP